MVLKSKGKMKQKGKWKTSSWLQFIIFNQGYLE